MFRKSHQVYPSGGTYLGRRIHDLLDAYMATLRYDRGLKPLNLVVFTDGEANDTWLLHWSIEEHVTHVIKRGYIAHQLGIEFVQVCSKKVKVETKSSIRDFWSRPNHRVWTISIIC